MSKLLISLLLSLSFSVYAQTLFDNNDNYNNYQHINSHIKKIDYIEVDENGHSINHSTNNSTNTNNVTSNNTNNTNANSGNSFQIIDNTKHNSAEVLFGSDNDKSDGDNKSSATSDSTDDGDLLFDNTNKPKASVKILTVDTSSIVAFQSDNIQSIQTWLDKGTSIDTPIYDKNTLLMIAAMHSREKIFNLAIEHKANLVIKNKNNETVLHWISYNNDTALLNDFIAAIGLDKIKNLINAQDVDGRTPLHYALISDKENPAFIERIIQLGANPNIQDNEGNTPVHMAFLKNHKDVYPILKKYSASFYIKNNGDLTPIQLALKVNSSWDFDYYNNFDPSHIK